MAVFIVQLQAEETGVGISKDHAPARGYGLDAPGGVRGGRSMD